MGLVNSYFVAVTGPLVWRMEHTTGIVRGLWIRTFGLEI